MLNPRVDFAFKKLFGTEDNKDILIDFINAIVSEEDQVADLILKNPYSEKDFRDSKQNILDIKAQSTDGTWFNIEMQILRQDFYIKRTLHYWAKIYSEQISRGINYDALNKTICINILNFESLDESYYHNAYVIKHVENNHVLSDDLKLHFIELNKYDDNSFKTVLDRWVNFLKKAEKYEINRIPQELEMIPTIKKAFTVLDTISLSKEEREIYDATLKYLRDEDMRIKTAHQEGFELGKLETAKNLLQMGLSIEQIAKATNLSLAQLNTIMNRQE